MHQLHICRQFKKKMKLVLLLGSYVLDQGLIERNHIKQSLSKSDKNQGRYGQKRLINMALTGDITLNWIPTGLYINLYVKIWHDYDEKNEIFEVKQL